ncbi:MAG TPA: protoporphyrinogen oxidase [Elusimicrobiota bacterium]|nr:protoporphyrinogen oxidase [Elusimicrobiota bacterium]
MSARAPEPRRVAVLGAGIAGLSAAFEIARSGRGQATVLEASERAGGKILSLARSGAVYEAGPDSFLSAKPDVLELAKELGLSGELVSTRPGSSSVSIYSGGRLRALKGGLWPPKASALLGSGLLSWRAKLRLALGRWAKPEPAGAPDESMADFVRRRFGQEVLERIADPLLAGIYAGDPEELSLESTFPQIKQALLKNGAGAARAPWRPPPGQSLFMTFRGGLSRLPEALCAALPGKTVRTGARVLELSRRGRQWTVETSSGRFQADVIISALPANALAPAVERLDPELAAALREIPFASTATVSFLYNDAALPRRPEGFGFLVPRKEGKAISAATYSSSKFPGRAPEGKTLVRCFLGGAGRSAAAEKSEEDVIRLAAEELSEILGLGKNCRPEEVRAWRWIEANPQYVVGHALRLRRLESCLRSHPGLILAGASYRGVGLPDCVRSGRAAARAAISPSAGFPAVA